MGRSARPRVGERERWRRDAAARADHERLVRETGEQRVLARARGGELVSYRPEEYGVGRSGLGPKLGGVLDHAVFVGFLVAVLVAGAVAVVRGPAPGVPGPPWWFWFLPLAWAGVVALFTRNLVRQVRAARARRERGLPEPVE